MTPRLSITRRATDAVTRRVVGALTPTIRAAISQRLDPSFGLRNAATYAAVTAYASRYTDEGDLTRYELRVFSQNGEDGVIAELARRVDAPRTFVEIGAGDGLEANCIALSQLLGWSGTFVEADPDAVAELRANAASLGEHVRITAAIVTPDNINAIIRDTGLDGDLGLLSIDVDGNDYWLWKAVEYRPAILVVEYNASHPVDEPFVSPLRPPLSWDETNNFGSSLRSFEELAAEKGYRLVYTDVTGVNAFFVRDDLVARAAVTRVPRRRANYFFSRRGHPDSPSASR